MKRILIGVLAGGLSLSALAFGAKNAEAAEPCAPQVVQPSGWYGYAPSPVYNRRLAIERARERRLEWLRERERLQRRVYYPRDW